MNRFQYGLVCLCMYLVFACKKAKESPVVPTEPEVKLFEVPKNFPATTYSFSQNTITKEGFELGKALFYDGILSRDSSIACGECHRQYFGFTHHLHDLSHGIEGRTGLRNALALQNLAFQKVFLWDGAVENLDLQPLIPIQHPDEMDDKIDNVLLKLKKHKTYPSLFKTAFGSDEITQDRLLKALSQFMVSLVSANSKYDKYIRKEANATLTDDELAGMKLFESKGCRSCHAGELFSDESFRNNGLSKFERTKPVYENGQVTIQIIVDEGRYRVTKQETDRFKFPVPSLRNIAATKPYMHDGRYTTLQEVLEHYNSRVEDTPNLDPIFKQKAKLGIALNDEEKRLIIAFLNTLTDTDFLTNKRFAEPAGFPSR